MPSFFWFWRCRIIGLAALIFVHLLLQPLSAVADQLFIIRDAETESLLRDYVRPIFKAASINFNAVQVIIVGDRAFNAFVANGQKIFVNAGTIIDTQTPNQLIGIVAHESGHIAHGDLAKMHEELAKAQIWSILGAIASAGAIAGTVASNAIAPPGSGVGMKGNAIAGIVYGPQEMVLRSLLAYQRIQEVNADRAALRFLQAANLSSKGIMQVFEKFYNDQLFSGSSVDPYLISHPMNEERMRILEHDALSSPYYNKKDDESLQFRHDLVRAKLLGFLGSSDEIDRVYPRQNHTLPALYAQAVKEYRFGSSQKSYKLLKQMIKLRPDNPYFIETLGQFELSNGEINPALEHLGKSVAMIDEPLINITYGHGLILSDNKANIFKGINILEQAVRREQFSIDAYKYLSIAYGLIGKEDKAALAAAEAAFLNGDYVTARQVALRAQNKSPAGSPTWLRSNEIINYKPPQT